MANLPANRHYTKQPRRPRQPYKLKEPNLILQAYDNHQTKELTFQEQHIHHNRSHEVLRMADKANHQSN
jgi:hypothetical protein